MNYYVLPAYNEAENIGVLLDKIAKACTDAYIEYRVIVVDDGSKDATAAILREKAQIQPVTIVTHEVNKGLAQTLVDGLQACVNIADDCDVIIMMDADNTMEPVTSTQLMIPKLEREGLDVVVASRYEKGGEEIGVPLMRKILSKGANVLLHFRFPIKGIKDYSCGYRAYRVGAMRKAMAKYGNKFVQSTAFSATPEILVKLGAVGVQAGEVPLVLRYDQKKGDSKIPIGKTIFGYIRMVFGINR